jgi:hypothetical protein
MKTLQVAQTTYTTYELTDAEVFALNIFLDIDVSYAVISRSGNQANTEAQLGLAIKWWRTRFPECGLKGAKDAIEQFRNEAIANAAGPRNTEIRVKGVPDTLPADSNPTYKLIGFISDSDSHRFIQYGAADPIDYQGRDVFLREYK